MSDLDLLCKLLEREYCKMSLLYSIHIFFIQYLLHFWNRNKIFQHFPSEFDKHSDNTKTAESEVCCISQLTNLRSISMPTSSRKTAIGVFLLRPSISLALATLN